VVVDDVVWFKNNATLEPHHIIHNHTTEEAKPATHTSTERTTTSNKQ
jgi:hypothetical protein